jgi:hypothetical protein
MTDRKSKHRLLKLEKLISTAEKERKKRETQLVKTVSAGAKIPHWKRPNGSVAPE